MPEYSYRDESVRPFPPVRRLDTLYFGLMPPHSFSRIFLANYSAREEQLVDVWPVVGQFHLLAPDWRRIVGMTEPSVSRGNGRHQQTHGMVDDPIEESLSST